MNGIWLFIFLVLLLYFWWDSMRCKEAARQCGLATCKKHGLQFLDDTVSLEKLSWQRNSMGMAALSRLYSFEFSSDGNQRYKGKMRVAAGIVSDIELPPYRIPELDQN